MTKKSVILVTRTQDTHCTPLVTQALEARGATAWCMNTDLYPNGQKLSVEFGKDVDRILMETDRGTVDLREAESLYYRRLATGDAIPSDMPAQLRNASVQESRTTLEGVLYGLRCFQLDGYDKVRRASQKQLQLQVGRLVGLDIPDTLSTNDPELVRGFVARHPGGVVAKALSSFAIYEEGREHVVFTNRIKEEDLEHLEDLQFSPMTFQEAVPKALELRVTIVGRQTFAASIDSMALDRSQVDWRREGLRLSDQWKPYDLPASVEASMHRLMDAFGLNYGAADFILTPEGRHVFLEVNPGGEFMWLQQNPGFPIAEAIADVLLDMAPRRYAPEWPLLEWASISSPV
jgi:glutathione synthase/RimK-type ligase-like ATP-grasp enzyme